MRYNEEYLQEQECLEESDSAVVRQKELTRTPANLSSLYNWKPFNCKQMERAELRNKWELGVRGLSNLLAASKITNPFDMNVQLLTLGGLELQEII